MSTHHPDEMDLLPPEDGGWYHTGIADWIALCPTVPHYAYRVYAVMRSLCIEKRPKVRRLTVEELRRLVPGVNGKVPGRSTVEGALRTLRQLGLIESLDAPTSGGAIRYRINDMPRNPDQYSGYRNTFDALEAIRAEMAAGGSEKPSQSEQAKPQDSEGPTQNSEYPPQFSEYPPQNSELIMAADQEKPGTPRSSTRSSTRRDTNTPRERAGVREPGLFDVDSQSNNDTEVVDAEFERFWEAYPRKVAKKEARRAFARAARTHGAQTLVKQAERWARIWRAAEVAKRFIPHPATWLNGERWDDEPQALSVPQPRATNGGHTPYRNASPEAYHANF
jgi:hypothetical protein